MNLGKGIIQDFNPFLAYVPADAQDHQDWPIDKQFKISYRMKEGEKASSSTQHLHLASKAAVKLWEAEAKLWAVRGQNSVEYTIYEWDLGPKVVGHYWI